MQKFVCKTCGAELFWDADAGALKCKYCDSEFQASDFEDETIKEGAEDKDLRQDTRFASSEVAEGMVLYKCDNCGAELVTSEETMATSCAYCGRAISITNKSAGRFRPEKLIPFAVNKDKMKEIYKKYLKSSWLVPKEFSEDETVNKIQGLYVPFWLHSMDTQARTTFECENISHRRRGDDRVTTHDVWNVIIDANGEFTYVPTDASKKLENSLMDALEPYNYNKIQDYNPAFMAGFFAEQPDEEKEDTVDRAKKKVDAAMREKANKDAGNWDSKILKNYDSIHNNEEVNYAMLPVWLLNKEYKNKTYTFAINGETGKVVGKLPMSIPKLLATAGITFLASNAALILINLINML